MLQPGREVIPGAISALEMLPGRFELPPDHAEGQRRAELAHWISSAKNPLTWRSIVNRVWQYHFGRGLVETSNDFGRMGAAPTHPELLDWLAWEFRDGGGWLKTLHTKIVTSAELERLIKELKEHETLERAAIEVCLGARPAARAAGA